VVDIVDEILEMLFETQMEKRAVIISFAESAITKILEENPEISALLLLYVKPYMTGSTRDKVENISRKTAQIGTQYVGPFSFQLEHLNPELVSEVVNNLTNNLDSGF
jgi:hypothetical protein